MKVEAYRVEVSEHLVHTFSVAACSETEAAVVLRTAFLCAEEDRTAGISKLDTVDIAWDIVSVEKD